MKLGAVTNTESIYQNTVNKDRTGSGAYTPGQILEGTVTEAAEKVTIDFSGKSLSFPKESVPGAEKGQIRRFQVTQVGHTGIQLREIGPSGQENVSGIIFTQVNSAQPAVLTEEPEQETGAEEEEPEDVADRMTGEDYDALAAEGFTLESYSLGRLERALERIKADREFKEETVEGFQEKASAKREEIKKIAASAAGSQPGIAEYLADLLMRADIPVTKGKIEDILKAFEYGVEAVGSGLGSSAKAYLIGNELAPEIDNLYKAAHSGSSKEQKLSDEVWEQLSGSAARVLAEAGREADAAGMEDARWLLEHELPLTAENLVYKAELDALPEGTAKEEILKKAVEAVRDGKSAGSAELARGPEALAAEAKVNACRRDFNSILPETVDAAAARLKAEGKDTGTELSLSFLLKLQQELAGQNAGTTIQDITARRQLEEIRLKLTAEAGTRLISQGIRLDTDGLGKIVEGLQKIEKEYYQKLYEEAGGEITDGTSGQIELLEQTRETVESLKNAPAYVLGVTFRNRAAETLQGMQGAGSRLAEEFRRAGESYEALMTRPRADMGDSIQKAFRNVDSLLNEMGLETTDANRRAVRILSYNNMELTQENLEEMKLYDAQVNELLGNMNPAACAALIKKGVNPLNMPVTELNDVLTRLREEEGASTEEKYSAYLVKLDRKKELTAEERESYIGIYRLLKQVVKTDGAALGAVVGSGREVTLSSLLSAVRTRKKGGVDASVDDEFGGIQEMTGNGVSISEQVGAAFRYQQVLAEQVFNEISPEKLSQAEQLAGAAAEEMSLEKLKEAMQQADAAEEALQYAETKLEVLNAAAADSTQELAFLSEFQQEKSIASLQAAKELLSSRSTRDILKALAEKYGVTLPEEEIDPDKIENAENMLQMVEKWTDSADKAIDSLFESTALTGEDSLRLLTLKNTVQLTKGLAKREFYEIPLRQESGFVKVNLTVVHSGRDQGSVSVRMKGEEEEVSFDIRMDEKSLNCYITTASRPEMERLMQKEAAMKQSLTEQGFEITQWNYGLKTRSADYGHYQSSASGSGAQENAAESGKTRTDDLYLAAKTMIKAAAVQEA